MHGRGDGIRMALVFVIAVLNSVFDSIRVGFCVHWFCVGGCSFVSFFAVFDFLSFWLFLFFSHVKSVFMGGFSFQRKRFLGSL